MTRLAWRFTRLGGRGAALSTGLTALAVAVATLLLQFAVAGNFAFAERAERTEWRTPDAAAGGEVVIATAVDIVGADAVNRVDLARHEPGADPAPPPGLDAFPEPGQIWLSPALADLLTDVPETDFLARYGGEVAGEIGPEALAHSDELLAVVGRDADERAMTADRDAADIIAPRTVDGFDDGQPDFAYVFYQLLMVLATILMAVPVAVFGAAAARLTVARRDERLATLRLIGATPGQVVRLTLIETTLAAAVGALVGTLAWFAVTPLVALIPIDGGPWHVADLVAGAAWTAVVAVAVPVMVAVSALVGLRGVVISPLGVARRTRPPGLRAIRLLVFAGMAAAFMIAAQFIEGDAFAIGFLMLLLAGTIATLNLAGPWVVQLLGRVLARFAHTPARLLAARRLADDPKAAWRTVAGVAMAGFIAGAVALFPMFQADTDPRETETLTVTVDGAHADALAAELEAELGALAAIETTTVPSDAANDEFGDDPDATTGFITATVAGADVEQVRSTMTAVLGGDPPMRDNDHMIGSDRFIGSIRVGVTVVLGVVLTTAAVSSGIAAIGSVLDRRKTYRLLHLSGTPQSVLDRARRQETLLPLAFIGGTSVLVGMALTAPLIAVAGFDVSGVLILGTTLAVGTAAVVGAGAASRPLLRAAMNDVSPRPD